MDVAHTGLWKHLPWAVGHGAAMALQTDVWSLHSVCASDWHFHGHSHISRPENSCNFEIDFLLPALSFFNVNI